MPGMPIINELLCFLQNHSANYESDVLALSCSKFYERGHVNQAKKILAELPLNFDMQSHRGSNALYRDIEALVMFLRSTEDVSVPVFVAQNLTNLPPCPPSPDSFKSTHQNNLSKPNAPTRSSSNYDQMKSLTDTVEKLRISLESIQSRLLPISQDYRPVRTYVSVLSSSRLKSSSNTLINTSDTIHSRKSLHVQHKHTRNIVGTRTSPDAFTAADTRPPLSSIYIGQCNPRTTEVQIMEFLQREGFTLKRCNRLSSDTAYAASFRLLFEPQQAATLLSACDLWPLNVIVRPFHPPRNRYHHMHRNNSFFNLSPIESSPNLVCPDDPPVSLPCSQSSQPVSNITSPDLAPPATSSQ